MTQFVSVWYGQQSVRVPLSERSLRHVWSVATAALAPNCPALVLAFETPSGDHAAVSSDFALTLVLSADRSAGRLVLVSSLHLPTVDQCMTTVLRAVVDTAARGEAAAVFLALSGAWEVASRELADGANVSVSGAAPVHTAVPPHVGARRRTQPLQTHFDSCVTRALENKLPECSRVLAETACASSLDSDDGFETSVYGAAESTVVACFCTHTGVSCSACKVQAIKGTRYRSGALANFCERCRRALPDASGTSFTVYDHPWEATDDYAQTCGDIFKAPRPPLCVGDVGPRVMHLQYVLYKVGYLNVCRRRFRAGVFCGDTRDAIRQFESEHRVGEQQGVYTALIRSVLLTLFDEVEGRRGAARCAAMDGANSTRFRTAMAA